MKRILVFGAPNFKGCWHQGFALCQLTDSYVLAPETTPAIIASTLAHEAMHGRLHCWGFGYEEDRQFQIERICFRASIAFARRLPDTEGDSREQIIATGLQMIRRNPTFWTDEG